MKINRREVVAVSGVISLSTTLKAQSLQASVHRPSEWFFTSSKQYSNPFAAIDLDVIVRDPDGVEFRITSFWAGSPTWRVRYAPAKPGPDTWRSVGRYAGNTGFDGLRDVVDAIA